VPVGDQLLDDASGQPFGVLLTGPDDPGAEQCVQREVPDHFAAGAGEYQHDVEAQPSPRGGGEPCVIALRRPRGDQSGGPACQCGGHRVLQLADLVAAAAEPDEVVALDPQILGG